MGVVLGMEGSAGRPRGADPRDLTRPGAHCWPRVGPRWPGVLPLRRTGVRSRCRRVGARVRKRTGRGIPGGSPWRECPPGGLEGADWMGPARGALARGAPARGPPARWDPRAAGRPRVQGRSWPILGGRSRKTEGTGRGGPWCGGSVTRAWSWRSSAAPGSAPRAARAPRTDGAPRAWLDPAANRFAGTERALDKTHGVGAQPPPRSRAALRGRAAAFSGVPSPALHSRVRSSRKGPQGPCCPATLHGLVGRPAPAPEGAPLLGPSWETVASKETADPPALRSLPACDRRVRCRPAGNRPCRSRVGPRLAATRSSLNPQTPRPLPRGHRPGGFLVGHSGLEPLTSTMSTWRSSQLS
jgi:hypothetical protein